MQQQLCLEIELYQDVWTQDKLLPSSPKQI